MKLCGKRAGIGHVHCHMLRHSVATELLSHGASPIGVERILGHRSLSTLLSTYSHACDTHSREAMTNPARFTFFVFPTNSAPDVCVPDCRCGLLSVIGMRQSESHSNP